MRKRTKKTQRDEMPRQRWTDYWPQDLASHIERVVSSMPEDCRSGLPIQKVLECCAQDLYIRDWILSTEKAEVVNGRTQVAFQLFNLVLNKPVLLEDVFRGGIIDEEPEGWWSALRGAGGQTAWFDLRHELASKHFKKSSAQDAVKISRGAKSGELDPQGIFMSLLSDEQSMAIALVALVGEAKRPMVMGVVLRQGEVDLWPDHMRTPALCGIRCWMEQKQLQIRPAAQVDPEPDSSTVTFGSGLQPLG